MTVEAVAREALTKYIQAQPPRKRRYSFVGIARSGKPNLSAQVDSILKNAANRREGWSLG